MKSLILASCVSLLASLCYAQAPSSTVNVSEEKNGSTLNVGAGFSSITIDMSDFASLFVLSGSPCTVDPCVFTGTRTAVAANKFVVGPISGANAAWTVRYMDPADLVQPATSAATLAAGGIDGVADKMFIYDASASIVKTTPPNPTKLATTISNIGNSISPTNIATCTIPQNGLPDGSHVEFEATANYVQNSATTTSANPFFRVLFDGTSAYTTSGTITISQSTNPRAMLMRATVYGITAASSQQVETVFQMNAVATSGTGTDVLSNGTTQVQRVASTAFTKDTTSGARVIAFEFTQNANSGDATTTYAASCYLFQ